MYKLVDVVELAVAYNLSITIRGDGQIIGFPSDLETLRNLLAQRQSS